MKIHVDHFKDKPYSLHSEIPVDSCPVLVEMQSAGACTFNGSILSDLTVMHEYDSVRASGHVSAKVSFVCSRCLATYADDLSSSFTIFYRKASSNTMIEEEELELNEQDLVSSTYSGDEIDFTREIQEQLAMEVPLKPLCSESCKGLCQICGIDLNLNSCSCQLEQAGSKFSSLKDFIVSKNSN